MDLWMHVQLHSLRRFPGSESESASDAHFREKLRRAFFMWWADIMAEQDVFMVPEHAEEATAAQSEPTLITPTEKQALYARGASSVEEHLLAASVVAQLGAFPGAVTCRILTFVGFLLTFEAETEEHRGGHNDMDDVYLQLDVPSLDALQLPRGVHLGRCVNLTAECCSHDQGWASFDREHNGTYRASYTWAEVATTTVAEPDGEPVEIAREIARAPISHNLRARNYFRHHCKQFTDPQGFAKHIGPNQRIELRLRSQFPGWTNTAKFGRLRAQFVLDIDEDFEPLSWTQIERLAKRRHRENWFCSIQ